MVHSVVVQQYFDGRSLVGQDVEEMRVDNVGSDGSHWGPYSGYLGGPW